MAEDASTDKAAFLTKLNEVMILSDACEQTGMPRKRIEAWRRNDAEFREALDHVELKKDDMIEKTFLIKSGVIPGIQNNHKWINDNLLIAWMKRKQPLVAITNTPAPLQIAGLTPEVIANLAKPEERKVEPKEAAVELLGTLPEKPKDSEMIQ